MNKHKTLKYIKQYILSTSNINKLLPKSIWIPRLNTKPIGWTLIFFFQRRKIYNTAQERGNSSKRKNKVGWGKCTDICKLLPDGRGTQLNFKTGI